MVVGSKFKQHVQPHLGFKDLIWNFANFWCNKKQANSELTERGNTLGVWWPKLCTKKLSTCCLCIAMEEVYSLNKEDDT